MKGASSSKKVRSVSYESISKPANRKANHAYQSCMRAGEGWQQREQQTQTQWRQRQQQRRQQQQRRRQCKGSRRWSCCCAHPLARRCSASPWRSPSWRWLWWCLCATPSTTATSAAVVFVVSIVVVIDGVCAFNLGVSFVGSKCSEAARSPGGRREPSRDSLPSQYSQHLPFFFVFFVPLYSLYTRSLFFFFLNK